MPLGFLNVDKPLGLTSHDVVAKVRRLARQTHGKMKVGHAGTLDPLATGVLVVCVGQATKLSDYVMHAQKGYQAEITLGRVTDTYDAEGQVIQEIDASHITLADVEAILSQFMGDIQQVPPMYSAIKKDGQKLYDLARAGETVELESRSVRIDSLTITHADLPTFGLDVQCSSGTYIRSLAYDIGQALGVGGYLSGLQRYQNGLFDVDDAILLDHLVESDDWTQHLITPHQALAEYDSVELSVEQIAELHFGRSIELSSLLDSSSSELMGYDAHKRLIAILEPRSDGWWKPRRVFPY